MGLQMVQEIQSDEGIIGLRDRPRSGKPSDISKEVKERIGQEELVNSNIGWDIKQVMDLVQKRTLESSIIKNTYTQITTSMGYHQRYRRKGL